LIIAANRDEYYARPASPPSVVSHGPRVLAGLDARAGGTWLGLNEHGVVAALTNRHTSVESAATPSRPSRGMLPLAALGKRTAREGIEAAASLTVDNEYNPFTLVAADCEGAWLLGIPDAPTPVPVASGWHVLGNRRLDDPDDPRVCRAFALHRSLPPALTDADAWVAALAAICGDHGSGSSPSTTDALCVHGETAGTVSASIILVAGDGAAVYAHADGRPCSTPFTPVCVPW
jgi:uncharacterized protein with NRDE domain